MRKILLLPNLSSLSKCKWIFSLCCWIAVLSWSTVVAASPISIHEHCINAGVSKQDIPFIASHADITQAPLEIEYNNDGISLSRVVLKLTPNKALRIEMLPKPDIFIDILNVDTSYEIISFRGDQIWNGELGLSSDLPLNHVAVLVDQLVDVQNDLYDDAIITLAVVSSNHRGIRLSIDDVYAVHVQNGHQSLDMIRFPVLGQYHWFNAKGRVLNRTFMQSPMKFRNVSSKYGIRRGPRLHKGVDFAADVGVPIRAMDDGYVKSAGWQSGYGRVVELKHTQYGDVESLYAHMSKMAVKPGTLVQKGQIIGYNGESGNATGPHLHYELKKNGSQINPKSIPRLRPLRLSSKHRRQFMDYRLSILQAITRQAPVGSNNRQNPFN